MISVFYYLWKISGRKCGGEYVLPYAQCQRFVGDQGNLEEGGFLAGWELTSRLLWGQRAVSVCVCVCVWLVLSA